MTNECRDELCPGLKDALLLASEPKTKSRISLLSTEGRVISAIVRDEKLIMKDIPHITGISFRTCFDCIRKLSDLGIIEKAKDPADKRSIMLKLNYAKLCETLCSCRRAS